MSAALEDDLRTGDLVLRPGTRRCAAGAGPGVRPRLHPAGGSHRPVLRGSGRSETPGVRLRAADRRCRRRGFPAGQRIRVVHVGGAALTVPRYVAATRPTSAQIVLEPDAELTAFVRTQLPLPPRSGIKVRARDGRTGLAELRDAVVELLIMDAFAGPRCRPTSAPWNLRRRPAGVRRRGDMIMNVTDRGARLQPGAWWPASPGRSPMWCCVPSRPPSRAAGSAT